MVDNPTSTSSTPTAASNIEATNASQLTQVLSTLVDNQADQSADVVAKVNAIAAAITSDIIGGSTGSTDNRILISKGTGGRALEASGVSADTSGNINTNGGDLIVDDITADDIAADDIAAQDINATATLTKNGANLALAAQAIGIWSGPFKAPEDETVSLILNFPFTVTITQTDTITEVGTATVTFNITGTPLGGSANAASTTLNTQAHSSANVAGVGDTLRVVFSSTSSDCENLAITVWGTRVLAS